MCSSPLLIFNLYRFVKLRTVTMRAFLSPGSASNRTQTLGKVLRTPDTALPQNIGSYALPFWSQKSRSNAEKTEHLDGCLSLSSWIACDDYRRLSTLSRSHRQGLACLLMCFCQKGGSQPQPYQHVKPDYSLWCGLSCALWDVWQHPWPPPCRGP